MLVAAGGFQLCFMVPGWARNARHSKTHLTYPNEIMTTGHCKTHAMWHLDHLPQRLLDRRISSLHILKRHILTRDEQARPKSTDSLDMPHRRFSAMKASLKHQRHNMPSSSERLECRHLDLIYQLQIAKREGLPT